MAREKIKKHHSPGEHIWNEPTEYKLPEEAIKDWERKSLEDKSKYLIEIPIGDYLVIDYLPAKKHDTLLFLDVIKQLEDLGINIGKNEESLFGYSMPFAEKGKKTRELRIFKRKVKEEKIFRRK